jgi:hypothetical protein
MGTRKDKNESNRQELTTLDSNEEVDEIDFGSLKQSEKLYKSVQARVDYLKSEIDPIKSAQTQELVNYRLEVEHDWGDWWIRLYPAILQYMIDGKISSVSLGDIDSVDCVREGDVYSTNNTYSRHSFVFDEQVVRTASQVNDDRTYRMTVRFNDGGYFIIQDPSQEMIKISEDIKGARRAYQNSSDEYIQEYYEGYNALLAKQKKLNSKPGGIIPLEKELKTLEKEAELLLYDIEGRTKSTEMIAIFIIIMVISIITLLIFIVSLLGHP